MARNTPFMEETAISAIAQGELPVVTGTPVLLEEGEVAHYYAPATKIVTKNKAVGRTEAVLASVSALRRACR